MKHLYIYCEGQTEESFISRVLYPYLAGIGIYVTPIIHATKHTAAGKFKGGVSDYQKIKKELSILCKKQRNARVTTMFDYYGLPKNTPGVEDMSGKLYERVSRIEKAVEADIDMPNLFFNLMVHEFEALLFTDTSAFKGVTDTGTVTELQKIRDTFSSPEHINNSVDTAPSKRIKELIPNYSKVSNGTIISERIGIDSMLTECGHFREWVTRIKSLC